MSENISMEKKQLIYFPVKIIIFIYIFIFFSLFSTERTKVKVTFYQSSKPQQISPPENHSQFFIENNNSILLDSIISDISNSIDEKMATATAIPPNYDRQLRYVFV